MKEPREPQAPLWFIAFEKKNDERWERQEAFNAKVIERLDNLEQKVDAIMECPTIKKELNKKTR